MRIFTITNLETKEVFELNDYFADDAAKFFIHYLNSTFGYNYGDDDIFYHSIVLSIINDGGKYTFPEKCSIYCKDTFNIELAKAKLKALRGY